MSAFFHNFCCRRLLGAWGTASNYKLQCQASDLRLRLVVNDDDNYEYYDDADENDMEIGW